MRKEKINEDLKYEIDETKCVLKLLIVGNTGLETVIGKLEWDLGLLQIMHVEVEEDWRMNGFARLMRGIFQDEIGGWYKR